MVHIVNVPAMILTNINRKYDYILNGEFRSIVDNNSDIISEKYKLNDNCDHCSVIKPKCPHYELYIFVVVIPETNAKINRFSIVHVDGDKRRIIPLSEFLHETKLAYMCAKLNKQKLSICKRITNYICNIDKLCEIIMWLALFIILCTLVLVFIDGITHS